MPADGLAETNVRPAGSRSSSVTPVAVSAPRLRTVTVNVEARLVDVETGELLATARATGRAKTAEKHAFGGKVGKLADPQAMIEQALMGVGDKLARQLAAGARPR